MVYSVFMNMCREKVTARKNINTNSGYIWVSGLRLILIIFSIFIFQIFYSDGHSFMSKTVNIIKKNKSTFFP